MSTTSVHQQNAAIDMPTALRIGIGLLLAAFGGLFFLLAFPPYGLWPLIWIAMVPNLYAQYRVMPPRLARLAHAVTVGVWLTPMLARVFAGGPWWLVNLGLIIAVISILITTERKFHDQTGLRWFVLYGVAGWVGVEMLRSFIPFLGTMGFVANTQASQAWLLQPISIFSIYGLGAVIMLVNYGLAQGLMALTDRKWLPADAVAVDPRASRRWLIVAGGVLAGWILLSLAILGTAPKDARVIRAGALQPGFPAPAHVDKETPQSLRVQTLLEQGREAVSQGAQLLFTPELGMAVDPQKEYTQEWRSLAANSGAYIFLTYGFDDPEGFRNEAVLLSPSGQFSQIYAKNRPSPGEPLALHSGVYPVFDTPLGRLATIICNDASFTTETRRLARNGAQLIAAPTRETAGIAEHQWTHEVMRAVETRTAIVKTDVAWGIALIDPYGRVLYKEVDAQPTRATVVRDIPLGSGKTLVNILGDWLGWVALAGFVFFIVFTSVIQNRIKKAARK